MEVVPVGSLMTSLPSYFYSNLYISGPSELDGSSCPTLCTKLCGQELTTDPVELIRINYGLDYLQL